MKKIKLILIGIILLVSCDNNFDPEITGALSPSNFPKSEADFELYMLQTYKPFGTKWGYQDLAYQNMFFGIEYGHIILFDLTSDIFVKFSEWGGAFESLSTPNFNFLINQGKASHFEKVRYVSKMTQIISDLEKSELKQNVKENFIAQVKTGRAMAMFYLLHMYGPLPVIFDPSKINTAAESDLTRPSRTVFVKYIEDDLKYAADRLEVAPAQYGRFNKGLALGYLMRLYMNEKNWADAKTVGEKIQGLGYKLVTNYASLFKEATEVNTETIWAVTVDPKATGDNLLGNFNPWAFYCLPSDYKGFKVNGGWSGQGVFTPSWAFYDSFETNDKRRNLMIAEYVNKSGQLKNRSNRVGPVLVKFPDESGPQYQGNDIPVLRYADVMLMLAEAINNLENGPTQVAIDLVNEVRAKHGEIGGLLAADYANKQAFNDAILRERGWDLYFEGVRKMDLIRHGKWSSALINSGKPVPPELFPVPRYAIDISNNTLSQTDGYN